MGGIIRSCQRAAQQDKFSHLKLQEKKILKSYEFLEVLTTRSKLSCTGIFKPLDYSDSYKVVITYTPFRYPVVYITDPLIVFNPAIHMYKDRSLCLYHPKDFEWNLNRSIAEHIVPRINEWIIFYEYWKDNKVWAGPEFKH